MVLLLEFGYAFVEKASVLTETSKIERYSLVLTLQLLMNLWTPRGIKFKKKSVSDVFMIIKLALTYDWMYFHSTITCIYSFPFLILNLRNIN